MACFDKLKIKLLVTMAKIKICYLPFFLGDNKGQNLKEFDWKRFEKIVAILKFIKSL